MQFNIYFTRLIFQLIQLEAVADFRIVLVLA